MVWGGAGLGTYINSALARGARPTAKATAHLLQPLLLQMRGQRNVYRLFFASKRLLVSTARVFYCGDHPMKTIQGFPKTT